MRALLLLLLLAGCGPTLIARGGIEVPSAASQFAGNTDPVDPFERINRHVLDFNTVVDDSVLRPLAETYVAVVPSFGRLRIRQFLDNLGEPLIFAHNILQMRLRDATTTVGRFALNTTLGGAGFFDLATGQGLARQTGDAGQTLARYGVGEGPYLMLPLLGPSNLRDAFGDTVDGFGNPLLLALGPAFSSYTLGILNASRGVLGGIDLRAENLDTLDALRLDSIDFYARLRSVARQRRAFGAMAAVGRTVPDALDDPDASPATVPAPLDDPGTTSAPPSIAPVRSGAAIRPLQVPPEWARATLGGAALDAPVARADLPARARTDPVWAGATLDSARRR